MGPVSFVRRAKDAMAKQKGLVPQRFVFSVRPISLVGIPPGVRQILLEWKGSGSKLTYTKVHRVSRDGVATLDETLNMTTTLYKGEGGFEAKEYVLKAVEVQEVKKMGRTLDRTVTLAQCSVDFSPFSHLCCTPDAQDEIEVQLHGPKGATVTLRATIRATFLKNWAPEDSRSDLSFMSASVTPTAVDDAFDYLDESDQDLFGLGGGDDSMASSTTDADSIVLGDSGRLADAGASVRSPRRGSSPSKSDPNARGKRHAHKRSMESLPVPSQLEAIIEESPEAAGARARAASAIAASRSTAEASATGGANSNQHKHSRSRSLFDFMRRMPGNSDPLPTTSSPAVPSATERRRKAQEREAVDLKAEEDIVALRERAVALLRERDAVAAKAQELKETLAEREAGLQDSDDGLVQQLVQTKLQLAEAEYKRLDLQLLLHVERNRTRMLSAKMTALGVQRDLLANRVRA